MNVRPASWQTMHETMHVSRKTAKKKKKKIRTVKIVNYVYWNTMKHIVISLEAEQSYSNCCIRKCDNDRRLTVW